MSCSLFVAFLRMSFFLSLSLSLLATRSFDADNKLNVYEIREQLVVTMLDLTIPANCFFFPFLGIKSHEHFFIFFWAKVK